MVEEDGFPGLLAVTFLALLPEIGSMDVVFLVTTIAVGRRFLFEQAAFVAALTSGFTMVAFQRIGGVPIVMEE